MTTCTDRNGLRQNNFRFEIPLAPTLAIFVQDVTLPGVTTGNPLQPTSLYDIPHVGDKLVYDTVDVTFLVQENMQNYKEIYNWFLRIADPRAFPQGADRYNSMRTKDMSKLYCDGALHILSNEGKIISTLYFKDMLPIVLSPLNFTTMTDDVMTASTTFAFSHIEFDTYHTDVSELTGNPDCLP